MSVSVIRFGKTSVSFNPSVTFLYCLIKLAYNNNHAKSSVWAISGQFNVLPFGEITAAMGG